jgi:HSP20 family protein
LSQKEEKKNEEIKEKAITPKSTYDLFDAFDNMRLNLRERMGIPSMSWGLWGRPWLMSRLSKMPVREACVDLVDTGKEYQVQAEVPGIPKENIDITVTKDNVEISGKTEVKRTEEDKGFIVRERGYSKFYRKMPFPEEVLPDKATATFKDGLLGINVPKKIPTTVEPEKYKIEIK